MTEAVLDNNEHAHTEAEVTKSSKPISRRDRETLRRLIKSHSEAELNDLISQERDQLVAPGHRAPPKYPNSGKPSSRLFSILDTAVAHAKLALLQSISTG